MSTRREKHEENIVRDPWFMGCEPWATPMNFYCGVSGTHSPKVGCIHQNILIPPGNAVAVRAMKSTASYLFLLSLKKLTLILTAYLLFSSLY